MMGELSLFFKALSEPLRLRILERLLSNGKEAFGGELASALKVPPYRLSRHLKVLKSTGLISERREGRWVYYSVTKQNTQFLGVLRQMMTQAQSSHNGGNGAHPTRAVARRRRGTPTRPRSLQARTEQKDFDWNKGPAIPGLL
ncbi:MAG: helix-turn-helix transcriptional regulator [Candidatus Omnitrophica bacterium]|nr:helix-turn-helix transcriptional regulator [Candidatus Omnitrophota bacterium]